jgi:uncharacterized ion transporter superfamily protein YfcC
VHFSRDLHRTTLGKSIVITVFGLLFGYSYDQKVRSNNVKAKALTLDNYTQGYDAYKAHLVRPEWPLWGHVALVLFTVALFFVLYELLGSIVGWVLLRLVPGLKLRDGPSDSDVPRPTA